MSVKSLEEIIRELVEADRVELPVHPNMARKILACRTKDEAGIKEFWSYASQDPALLCRLFRTANSSFYAGLPRTLSISEAVTRLGVDEANELVTQACRSAGAEQQGAFVSRYMPHLWQHAQGCGTGARWLAQRCGYEGVADQAYLAGLLHDVGKNFLLSALQEIDHSKDYDIALSAQLVLEVMTTMHVEQGLRLFDEWNLPEIYRTVVAEHHDEEMDSQNIVVALVRLANKGCCKIGLGLEHNPELVLPTTAEAQFLGTDEITLAELEIMLEDQFLGGDPVAAAAEEGA